MRRTDDTFRCANCATLCDGDKRKLTAGPNFCDFDCHRGYFNGQASRRYLSLVALLKSLLNA